MENFQLYLNKAKKRYQDKDSGSIKYSGTTSSTKIKEIPINTFLSTQTTLSNQNLNKNAVASVKKSVQSSKDVIAVKTLPGFMSKGDIQGKVPEETNEILERFNKALESSVKKITRTSSFSDSTKPPFIAKKNLSNNELNKINLDQYLTSDNKKKFDGVKTNNGFYPKYPFRSSEKNTSNKPHVRYNSTGDDKEKIVNAEKQINLINLIVSGRGQMKNDTTVNHTNVNANTGEKAVKRPLSSVKLFEKNAILKGKVETKDNIERSDVFVGSIDEYKLGIEIGKGSFATVKQATHKNTGEKFAVKIYDKNKLVDSARRGTVKREIEILKKLTNKFTIKLYEVIETTKYIFIIMELVNGTSLLSYLRAQPGKKIPEKECLNIFSQIIEGINYLHSLNIVHRDLKLDNIIINTHNKQIKIIDYGFGCITSWTKELNFFCGTPSYMPPEIVQKKEYIGFYCDIWSLGIVLYALLCGCFPFKAMSEKDLYAKILKGIYKIPEHISIEGNSLIKKLLIVNPKHRMHADEILEHNWFKPRA